MSIKKVRILSSKGISNLEDRYNEFVNNPNIIMTAAQFSTIPSDDSYCRFSIAVFYIDHTPPENERRETDRRKQDSPEELESILRKL